MGGLMSLLQSDMGKQIIGGLSNETGIDEAKAAEFAGMAMPLIMGAMKKNLDKLVKIAQGNPKLTMTYAPFYKSVFKDEKETVKILENLNDEYFYTQAISSLSSYYEQKGDKDKAVNVFLKNIAMKLEY